jgi:hypothetical protein
MATTLANYLVEGVAALQDIQTYTDELGSIAESIEAKHNIPKVQALALIKLYYMAKYQPDKYAAAKGTHEKKSDAFSVVDAA